MTHSLNLQSVFTSKVREMLREDDYSLDYIECYHEEKDEYGNDRYSFNVYILGAPDIDEASAVARFKVDEDGVITGDIDYNI